MIAAVTDPRGASAAAMILARIAASFRETHVTSCSIVARGDDPEDGETELRAGERLEVARSFRAGALVAVDAEIPGALVLARGALGGRPLYYARTDAGGWVVCSRIQPLLRAIDTKLAPDPDRLAALAMGVESPRVELTPYVGIARVAPCTAVRLRPGDAAGPTLGRMESAPRPRAPLALLEGTPRELAVELWDRVERSVARAIGDARSVAVMVGGGVDSSGLLAAAVASARGASKPEVHALALDFDAVASDRPYLADLARALGIVPVRIDPKEAAPFYRRALVLDAQPYILTIGPMELCLFHRAKELGADVVLTGYLADETLAGEPRALSRLVVEGRPIEALRAARRMRVPWSSTPTKQMMDWVVRPLLKPFVPTWVSYAAGARWRTSSYPWAGERVEQIADELLRQTIAPRPPYTPDHRFDRLARSSLFTDYADWRGQLEATVGIVRKDPYADEDVLDLVARVPPELVTLDGLHRGLFRAAVGERIPSSIRQRIDKSWFEPAFAAVAEAAGGLRSLGDLWRPRELERLGIVNAAAFEASMAPLFRSPSSSDECAVLWSHATQVLACESFVRGLVEAS